LIARIGMRCSAVVMVFLRNIESTADFSVVALMI
jgi:hypothetical protein